MSWVRLSRRDPGEPEQLDGPTGDRRHLLLLFVALMTLLFGAGVMNLQWVIATALAASRLRC